MIQAVVQDITLFKAGLENQISELGRRLEDRLKSIEEQLEIRCENNCVNDAQCVKSDANKVDDTQSAETEGANNKVNDTQSAETESADNSVNDEQPTEEGMNNSVNDTQSAESEAINNIINEAQPVEGIQ